MVDAITSHILGPFLGSHVIVFACDVEFLLLIIVKGLSCMEENL